MIHNWMFKLNRYLYIFILLQRGLHQLQQFHHATNQDGSDQQKSRSLPLMIQGLRTNPKDPESHILVFDIEALIGMVLFLLK